MTTNPNRYALDRVVSEELRVEIIRARAQMNEVSAATGIASTTLSRKVNGHSALTVGELGAVASVLGTTATDLVARAESAAGHPVPTATTALAAPTAPTAVVHPAPTPPTALAAAQEVA